MNADKKNRGLLVGGSVFSRAAGGCLEPKGGFSVGRFERFPGFLRFFLGWSFFGFSFVFNYLLGSILLFFLRGVKSVEAAIGTPLPTRPL
jgi:hypothetical protein